ncbi:uncharacterized protein MONBRDRAFT_27996 [Monosiga brevicollis MX1]|uniref:tRNA (guanine-N(7)-)-methyltransferase n=1 Tax=Monosiga brevicollis TaxID=81824 RepID=A9V6W8_MONBE|nr:uncharacterized protein MONBRDRAFT_27996 [Monosiga brevicollis MX1]EDQ86617.1 predicted protein [Monosiga brevicollis MX1]|eukprot:XP_001748453.1 hypothetical protein [Monosiga brevicollis MX1]
MAGIVSSVTGLPQKRFYRQRAHSNPLADHVFVDPIKPVDGDWSPVYPIVAEPEHSHRRVEFLDVGCGYGGLLVELSGMFPETLMLGIEIRVKVADYVNDRIRALRIQEPGSYQNVGVIRTNAMKFLPNYFAKHQLSKMFFLYPDPHFKKKKHKWRIISDTLLDEYAYVLREGRTDPIVPKLYQSTEEGKKVYRNKAAGENHGDGDVRLAVFRRIARPTA